MVRSHFNAVLYVYGALQADAKTTRLTELGQLSNLYGEDYT